MALDLSKGHHKLGLSLILHKLDGKRAATLSNRILDRIPVTDPSKYLLNDGERLKFVESLSLENEEQLSTLLTTLYELWRQITYSTIKPQKLETQLRELEMPDSLVTVLIDVWVGRAEEVSSRLKSYSTGSNQVGHISWSLNVDASSDRASLINLPKAVIGLDIKRKGQPDKLVLDMDHSDLNNLYNTLENIQSSLDSLMTK